MHQSFDLINTWAVWDHHAIYLYNCALTHFNMYIYSTQSSHTFTVDFLALLSIFIISRSYFINCRFSLSIHSSFDGEISRLTEEKKLANFRRASCIHSPKTCFMVSDSFPYALTLWRIILSFSHYKNKKDKQHCWKLFLDQTVGTVTVKKMFPVRSVSFQFLLSQWPFNRPFQNPNGKDLWMG